MKKEFFQKTSIKVIILTDHLIFGDGLKNILGSVQDISVIGKTTSITETIEISKVIMPDVILMDGVMLEAEGRKLFDFISKSAYSTKVLILAESSDEETTLRALSFGISGYINRKASSDDMIKAIKTIHGGEVWIERGITSKFIVRYSNSRNTIKKLTIREQEIALLIAKGCSNKEIANILSISEKTVKSHISNIFKKMEVSSRFKIVSQLIPFNHH